MTTAAEALHDAIDAFVAGPTDATLQAAKDAWLAGRRLYGPTEVFRFYDGPIDNPDDGPEGQINAWPMDEAYVDYADGDPEAGIVNDVASVPEITDESSSPPTRRAARPTSPPAGTPSSSSSGART